MYKLRNILLLSVILLSMAACNDDHWLDFTKSTGRIVKINRVLDTTFNQIYIQNDVNLVITQAPEYSLMLEGGENLLPGIETKIIDSVLYISNKNMFNWVRAYNKKITAYLSLPQISEIRYEASSNVSNNDTIREDTLNIITKGGSGLIDLKLKVNTTRLYVFNGSVDYKISGTSSVTYLYSAGLGPFHCADLVNGFLFITNSSSNDCYVNAFVEIGYTITGLGNIYYKGNPAISGYSSSKGKLIKID